VKKKLYPFVCAYLTNCSISLPKLFLSVLILIFSSLSIAETKPNNKTLVYQFAINQEIMPAALRITNNAFKEANQLNADVILLHLNTYGGLLNIADSIRTKILNAKQLVIVFIDKNAASAGALISIACDSIYMTSGATIGAATVVNQTGEQMPDKYQSYMRGMMRSTAESQGRNPKIAEAMVDDRIEIAGVIEAGKVLTFTTSEAIKHNFCDGEAEDISEVLALAHINNYKIVKHTVSVMEKIIAILINPALNGILLMIIIGGIYFELQTPGVGFPIIASFVAGILYFAPLYLEGLAANWEIAIFITGLFLIGLELFVIPGFGIAGISGIAFILTGLILSMVQNNLFDFDFSISYGLDMAILKVIFAFLGVFIIGLIIGKSIMKSKMFDKIVLSKTESAKEGYTAKVLSDAAYMNVEAEAATDLNPAGKILIKGDRVDGSSDGGFIEKGSKVKVIEVRASHVIVEKI